MADYQIQIESENFSVGREGERVFFIPKKVIRFRTHGGSFFYPSGFKVEDIRIKDYPVQTIGFYENFPVRLDNWQFAEKGEGVIRLNLIAPSEYEPYFDEIRSIVRRLNATQLDLSEKELLELLGKYEGSGKTLSEFFSDNGYILKKEKEG